VPNFRKPLGCGLDFEKRFGRRPWPIGPAILVFHNGLDPESLTGAVVEALMASEIGVAGDVRHDNEVRPHTQFTASQRVNRPPDELLSRLLADGKQNETLRPYRPPASVI